MSNTTMISTAAIALNITSLTGTIFMGIICILMLIILLQSIINNNKDIVLILAANNYLALFAFAVVSISANIDMARGDFHLFVGEETLSCRIRGYVMYSVVGVIFNTFALQAAFRFFRVVYPSYMWLQHRRTYAVIIPVVWIMSFLLVLPAHLWRDIQLMPMENVCLMAMHSLRGIIWCTVSVYFLPLNVISTIYLQLMRFMRRSTMVASTRTKRDVIVVRRIILVVSILMLIGVPSVVLELMLPFTDVGKPLFYRISNITMVLAMIALSFMLIYVTPQVKEIIVRISKRNQIAPPHTHQGSVLTVPITKY